MQQWVKWLLGIVAALVVASAAGGTAKVAEHGERITRTETQFEHLRDGQRSIDRKLDRVIERLYRQED